MNTILFWAMPPIVGAAIGYITNAIAIKMLFRPLAEKRVLGVRVPFTPGILPRQRHKLADNIGRMVARELLTEDIIRERINRPDFRLAVERSLSEYTTRFFKIPLSDLSLFAPRFESGERPEYFKSSDVARFIGGLVARFIASPVFKNLLDNTMSFATTRLGQMSFRDLLGEDKDAVLEPFAYRFASSILDALNEPGTLDDISNTVREGIEPLLAERKSLSDILPPGSLEYTENIAQATYPHLAESAIRFLKKPDIRAEMERRGRVFLRDVILKLNTFQRFFLSAAQYDRTLDERLPEIIDDLIEQITLMLRDDLNRARFAEGFRAGVERFLTLPVDEAVATLKTTPEDMLRRFVNGALEFAKTRIGVSGLANLFTNVIHQYIDIPIAELLENKFDVKVGEIGQALSSRLLDFVRDGDPAVPIARFVDAFLAERGNSSLSELLSLDAEEKTKIDRIATDRILALLDERISAMLSTLDVRTLVAERIDSLDMQDVEQIVLSILANQLRWINVFGAFLGALIGVIQATLTVFLR